MSIIGTVEKSFFYFTKSERMVAEYVLSKPHNVISSTVEQLAQESNTSEASITRFCKRLGINSFRNFKIELAKELNQDDFNLIYNSPIQFNDNLSEVTNKIITKSVKALESTLKLTSTKDLKKVVNLLNNAYRIYLYGAGGSSVVAHDFLLKLLRVDTLAFQFSDMHVQLMSAANMTQNDILFLISTSGKTNDVLKLLSIAEEKNTPTVLLTQHKQSPARNKANVVIDISLEEENIRIGTMSARIAQLAMIDAIFTGLCIEKGIAVYNKIFDTYNIVSKMNE